MNKPASSRAEAVDIVAKTLTLRASRLLRLLASFGTRELTRTESGLLATLLDGPRRITELATSEALAQPTVTKLVDRLEGLGFVTRERSEADGRVVMVTITAGGRAEIAAVREQVRSLMRETVASLTDDELAVLIRASDTLEKMIDSLQSRRVRS
ncbi:MAG: MarR family transcriptional regulator [Actinomycetes bacterium]